MGIDHQKVLLVDRGDHAYIAEAMAEKAAKVWHYTPILGRQPKNRDDQIGSGLDGVEKVDDFEQYKDKADLIIFPGEYDGEICNRMWEENRRAFGSGLSTEIEINRKLFLDTLQRVELPIIKTYISEGLDDAIEYLTGKTDKWIKASYNRGDFDTKHYHNMKTFMPWLTFMRNKLGQKGADTVELLIQNSFKALVESGWDGYNIDGRFSKTGTIGYEKKDQWYIYRIVEDCPDVLKNINDKMSPEFKKRGYRGAYSTEARINESGAVRFTDLTARFGSPPGEGICESYTSFAQDVFDVANGDMPKMEYKDEYGAMLILTSSWNEEQEVCVDFPKEIKNNIKLRHSYKHKGNYYCVPNESSGFFGAVAAQGNTLKEAVARVNECAEQVICLDLEYHHIRLEEAEEMVKDGHQFGLEM